MDSSLGSTISRLALVTLATLAGPLGACGISSTADGDSPVTPAAPPPGAPPPADTAPGAPPAPPIVAGEPITAPERTWTWVDVAGAKCADGSKTGIGVNLTSKSDDVLVFLEGGGACWDAASCWGAAPTAINLNGYGKLQLDTDPQIASIYLLDRSNTDNPFRDKNIVYVPYCTGDSYSGDNATMLTYLGIEHETHFVGHRNMNAYLSRLVATFPKAKRVWLAGDSAGGFGASFNFGTVQEAFGSKSRVDVIDDSGQPIEPAPATWSTWRTAWKMQLPADCAACQNGPSAFVDYYRTKYPNNRFGLISYEYDVVIAPFMSLSLGQFHDELTAMLDHFDASFTNGRYFVLPGASHVGLVAPTGALKDWVTKMVTDVPSWGSVRP